MKERKKYRKERNKWRKEINERKKSIMTQVQFLDRAVCISHHTNTLGKDINHSLFPITAMGR